MEGNELILSLNSKNLIAINETSIHESLQYVNEVGFCISPCIYVNEKPYYLKKEILIILIDILKSSYTHFSSVHDEFKKRIENILTYKCIRIENKIDFLNMEITSRFSQLEKTLGFIMSYDIEEILFERFCEYLLEKEPVMLFNSIDEIKLSEAIVFKDLTNEIRIFNELKYLKSLLEIIENENKLHKNTNNAITENSSNENSKHYKLLYLLMNEYGMFESEKYTELTAVKKAKLLSIIFNLKSEGIRQDLSKVNDFINEKNNETELKNLVNSVNTAIQVKKNKK